MTAKPRGARIAEAIAYCCSASSWNNVLGCVFWYTLNQYGFSVVPRRRGRRRTRRSSIMRKRYERATTTVTAATLCLCTFCFLGMTQDGLSWVLGYKHKQ